MTPFSIPLTYPFSSSPSSCGAFGIVERVGCLHWVGV